MQGVAPSDIFLFEDFRLDRRGGLSRCNGVGKNEPIAIGSRALDILGVLIERAAVTAGTRFSTVFSCTSSLAPCTGETPERV
jgi:hypothetical protein